MRKKQMLSEIKRGKGVFYNPGDKEEERIRESRREEKEEKRRRKKGIWKSCMEDE
jgi:hypothetical protein